MSIIVGYWPSPQGRAAVRAAAVEANLRRTPLVVAVHGPSDEAHEDDEIRSLMGDRPPHVRVLRSDEHETGDFLLQVASDEDTELLVIGLRGASPSGKLTLGSAARRVILSSPSPVLAVKDTPGAETPAGKGSAETE